MPFLEDEKSSVSLSITVRVALSAFKTFKNNIFRKLRRNATKYKITAVGKFFIEEKSNKNKKHC